MHNVLPLYPAQDETRLEHALVKGGGPEFYLVQTAQGIVNARVAFSCLVKPCANDQILLSGNGQAHFILAVLARTENAMEIELQGDARISATGSLTLHSQRELNLASQENVRLTGIGLHLVSALAKLTTQTLQIHATHAESDHDEVQFRTRTLSSWAQNVFQRADTVMRWVEGVETANVGQWVKSVRQAYTLHAQHAVITARGDVRIDGERIHMG